MGGSARSGEFAVDGDVDAEYVVVGSDWAGCDPDSPDGMDGLVGVLAEWLVGPVGRDFVEYHGSLCC